VPLTANNIYRTFNETCFIGLIGFVAYVWFYDPSPGFIVCSEVLESLIGLTGFEVLSTEKMFDDPFLDRRHVAFERRLSWGSSSGLMPKFD